MSEQNGLQREIESFSKKIALAKTNTVGLKSWEAMDVQEQALAFCLQRAADLAERCLLVASVSLTDSLGVLLRGLYESFLWSYWITASKENAQKFADNSIYQLKKIAAQNLSKGYARFADPQLPHETTDLPRRSLSCSGRPRRRRPRSAIARLFSRWSRGFPAGR